MSELSAAPSRRVLVAGTAGGVGTTTVAALLFALWPGGAGAPQLGDRTGGTLGLRLPEGDDVPVLDTSIVLVDAGPRAFQRSADLADPAATLVLVSAATPEGCSLAAQCLDRIRDTARYHLPASGPQQPDRQARTADPLARTALVLVGSHGRQRLGGRVAALAARQPGHALTVLLPPDRALAAGGRVPLSRLSEASRTAVLQLGSAISSPAASHGARVSA